MLSQWRRIAPRVWGHFGLDCEQRVLALAAARMRPEKALACYRAIVRSLWAR